MASSPRPERTDYAVGPWVAKPGRSWTCQAIGNFLCSVLWLPFELSGLRHPGAWLLIGPMCSSTRPRWPPAACRLTLRISATALACSTTCPIPPPAAPPQAARYRPDRPHRLLAPLPPRIPGRSHWPARGLLPPELLPPLQPLHHAYRCARSIRNAAGAALHSCPDLGDVYRRWVGGFALFDAGSLLVCSGVQAEGVAALASTAVL